MNIVPVCIHFAMRTQSWRNFYISIFVAIAAFGLVIAAYFCVTIALVLLIQTVCASDKGIDIYNKITMGIPIGTIVCAIENIGDEQLQAVINCIGGVIMVMATIFTLLYAYKCCTSYISIIFHFITPQEKRKRNWLACLYSREYVSELLRENFGASCVFISLDCAVYMCGTAFLPRDIAGMLNGSFIVGFPIIYYAIMTVIKLCEKPTNMSDSSINSEALLSDGIALV